MRVPDEVRKCVVFLGKEVGFERKYGGTAFVVSMQGEIDPSTTFLYLVTAQHCADEIEGNDYWVRVNTRLGPAVEIEGVGTHWFRHPTDAASVDVAVCPFFYNPTLDAMTIGAEDSVRSGWDAIGTGDEVFITGLFSLAKGSRRNMPIVRMGNIAMIPEDRIPVKRFGDIDAYLIEARSIGGVSGSPVFVRETVGFAKTTSGDGRTVPIHGTGGFHLLGLMHGHWDIDPSEINNPSIAGVEKGVNLGIAIVVPAYKIIEVLNHPELVAMRERLQLEKQKEKGVTVIDSGFHEKDKEQFTKQDFENALKQVSRKIPASKR